MTLSSIQRKDPVPAEIEAGKKYFYCPCNKSSSGVFCDGSHKGSEHSSIPIISTETKIVYLCACRQSNVLPYCDGSHVHPPRA